MNQSQNSAYVSKVWSPQISGDTYRNPVLYADYSDPDVIRVGRDYYMTASSFSCIPGLLILHSKDLVNWTLVGHALRQYPDNAFDRPQHGKGVWAPSIRYHNNNYYIYWGDPDRGIYMVRSDSIYGPWEEPVLVLPGLGLIDSCPLWDEDGKAYLVHGWAASRVGVNSLLTVHSMNAEGTKVNPDGKHVFDGHGHSPTTEGPKFYKRNGYYYILAPAGGVKTGWQLALRSQNIYGPYERKIVLEQGSSPINGPHQGGWVETPSGQSWFLHFQDMGAYGRVAHLQPVVWQEDWPMMGKKNDSSGKWEPLLEYKKPECETDAPVVNPVESDEFNSDKLGLHWQWPANSKLFWYNHKPAVGCLRLFAVPVPKDSVNLADVPNVLLQKFPAPDFTATTKIKLTAEHNGKRAGLTIMGEDYACLYITKKTAMPKTQARSVSDGIDPSLPVPADGIYSLVYSTCKNALKEGKEETAAEISLPTDTVYLRVKVTSPDAKCQFSYSIDGNKFEPIGKEFPAVPGRWIGAKVGLFCVGQTAAKTGDYADIDWFRIE